MRDRIKANEYERLDEETKIKLINKEEHKVVEIVKNLIVIRNRNNYEIISDKTIGIIICKQDNKYCFDNRIIAREYDLV